MRTMLILGLVLGYQVIVRYLDNRHKIELAKVDHLAINSGDVVQIEEKKAEQAKAHATIATLQSRRWFWF